MAIAAAAAEGFGASSTDHPQLTENHNVFWHRMPWSHDAKGRQLATRSQTWVSSQNRGVEVPSSVSADPKSMQNCTAWCCFTCVINSQWGRPPGGSPLPMSSEMMGVDHGFVGGIRVPGPRRSQRLQISGSQIKRSTTRHSIWVSLKISCPQIRWLTIG